jgi:predicted GIY-YIG superfamily endonuclease
LLMAGHKESSTKSSRMVPRACRGADNLMYHVYVLRCADGSFYVGSAQDLNSRVKDHNEGRGAAYTFKHRPVRLVYSESFGSEDKALRRERQLKHWSHGKKDALIKGDLERLKHLSRRVS